jgi:hypothetical protein
VATAAWPLQVAIYTRLTGDAELGATAGVFDEVPESAPYPHVAFGTFVETPMDAHDQQGLQVDVTLHIWSKYRGYAECAEILGHLDRLLDRQPLVVEGFTKVSVARDWHQFLRDPDPDIRHCPVRFRVWLAKES